MDLVVATYELTKSFPDSERYGLVSQMRRSAVSIPSNVAEGKMRGGEAEFRRFLDIALGSLAELKTQIEIAKRVHQLDQAGSSKIDQLIVEVGRMLSHLIVNRR